MSVENIPIMDTEFLEMRESNYLSIIKLLAKHDPELIKRQVNSYGKDNVSFFVNFLLNIPSEKESDKNEQIRKEFLDFCEEHGYKLTNNTYLHNSKTKVYGHLKNSEEKTLPDYLHVLSSRGSDELLLTMTEKLGKEYFLELEKRWDFLPYVYKAGFTNTIKKLTEYGVTNKPDILEHVEYKKEMINLYWEMVKVNRDSLVLNNMLITEQLEDLEALASNKDIQWINTKIKRIELVKNSSEATSIKEYLNVRFPLLSLVEKQKILIELMASKDASVLNAGLKLLSTNMTKYESEDYPLWTGINKITNGSLLNTFLEQKININTYHEKTSQYFIKEVLICLDKLKVEHNIKDTSMRHNNTQMRDHAIMSRVNNLIPNEFWLSPIENKNYSWFSELIRTKTPKIDYVVLKIHNIACEDRFIWNNMMYSKEFEPLTSTQKKHIKAILNKTIFEEDENGIATLEYCNNYQERNPLYNLINEQFLTIALKENIFTSRQKEKLLTTLINISKIASSSSKNMCQQLSDDMIEDENVQWGNIKIKQENEKSLQQYPLFFEIKARALVEKLNNKIPPKEEKNIQKRKI